MFRLLTPFYNALYLLSGQQYCVVRSACSRKRAREIERNRERRERRESERERDVLLILCCLLLHHKDGAVIQECLSYHLPVVRLLKLQFATSFCELCVSLACQSVQPCSRTNMLCWRGITEE